MFRISFESFIIHVLMCPAVWKVFNIEEVASSADDLDRRTLAVLGVSCPTLIGLLTCSLRPLCCFADLSLIVILTLHNLMMVQDVHIVSFNAA